jgi:hypothetical protein
MFLNDAPGALPAMPARSAIGPNPGWFAQNPAGGAGTVLGAEWCNMIQAELLAIVAAAGLATDKGNDGQLLAAIRAIGGPPTGFRGAFTGPIAPAGWVRGNGLTIGGALSNATERANADTFALFSLHWPRADLQLFNAAGAPIARGASATADFAANCALALPDYRDRVGIGEGTMGNVAASRITVAGGNFDTTTLGATGGHENDVLAIANLPPNTAIVTGSSGSGGGSGVQAVTGEGSATPVPIIQPGITEIVIIKL